MKRLLTLSALGAACALTLPATAQNGLDLESSRISVRVGAFFPFDAELRNLDTIWFQAGLDFEFSASLFRNAVTVISADWMSRVSGARDNAFPIFFSQRWYSGGDEGGRTYWHAGIGAAVTDFQPADLLFAARAGVGREFGERMFVEGNVMWSDEDKGGRSVTGASAFVGFRF